MKPDSRDCVPVPNFGFYNDLDGGLDSYPVIASSNGNYWVSYVEAEQMKELLDEDHFEKHVNVKYPEKQQKLREMLKNIKEDDDQILVLMKLKKGI